MLISFSTNIVCCHCSKTFHKTDKRKKACRPCAELSRLQKLPHQIEAKRAYQRDSGRQPRRQRGDKKFKGEDIRCARGEEGRRVGKKSIGAGRVRWWRYSYTQKRITTKRKQQEPKN